MNPNDVITQAKTKFNNSVEHFEEELKKLRTGRAHGGMLDGVMVEAYGTPMPMNQVANVTAPEAQLLQITPFDPSNLTAISAAIRDNQSLGMNPSDDGHVIRVSIPALTEERRREITKQVGAKLEDCMISLRGTRHETLGNGAGQSQGRSGCQGQRTRNNDRLAPTWDILEGHVRHHCNAADAPRHYHGRESPLG
jgi:ribosome recycling factor